MLDEFDIIKISIGIILLGVLSVGAIRLYSGPYYDKGDCLVIEYTPEEWEPQNESPLQVMRIGNDHYQVCQVFNLSYGETKAYVRTISKWTAKNLYKTTKCTYDVKDLCKNIKQVDL